MKRIEIIGMGLLGSAVASRLLRAKFQVKGYDTRPAQLQALQVQGLIAAGSIAEVSVDSDAVFTILPLLESVETTILGRGGLVETALRDCTLIQMSTISPELTRRLASVALAGGLGFLDTPMSGTSAMSSAATARSLSRVTGRGSKLASPSLTQSRRKRTTWAMPGWPRSRSLPQTFLSDSTPRRWLKRWCSAQRRSGSALLVEILKDSAGDSKMLEVRGPLMVSRRFAAQMKLDLFLKDFKLMLDEGLRLGVPLPLTIVTQQLATATAAAGRGEEVLAAIVTTLERLAGLEDDSPLEKKSN